MVGSEPMEEIIIFVKDQGQYKIALPKVEKIFDLVDFDPSNSVNEKNEKEVIDKINKKIDLENDKHIKNLKKYLNPKNLNIYQRNIKRNIKRNPFLYFYVTN
ncbi:MAG: hypothetical protein QXU98_13430 [Candidatus Parvarchaeota archaeon]